MKYRYIQSIWWEVYPSGKLFEVKNFDTTGRCTYGRKRLYKPNKMVFRLRRWYYSTILGLSAKKRHSRMLKNKPIKIT